VLEHAMSAASELQANARATLDRTRRKNRGLFFDVGSSDVFIAAPAGQSDRALRAHTTAAPSARRRARSSRRLTALKKRKQLSRALRDAGHVQPVTAENDRPRLLMNVRLCAVP
jgi:hypothetical protein